MLNDAHVHTIFSSDSGEEMENQIIKAVELGMSSLTVTDHYDYDAVSEDGMTFLLDFEAYFKELERLKEMYRGRLELLFGIELGMQLHISDHIKEIVKKYAGKLDFVIGSSHFVDGMDVYYPSFYAGRDEYESYMRYFEVSLERIKKIDDFDSFGHLDYVVRYGPNKNKFYDYRVYRDVLDEILCTLIKKDKALEVNTAGFKYGLNMPNPSVEVLSRYRELGGRLITVGSDAHNAGHLGNKFDVLEQMLAECGYTEYFVYRNRQPVAFEL